MECIMAYAVSARIEPITLDNLKSIQAHNLREFSEEHVDETRSHLNRRIVGSGDFVADMEGIVGKYKLSNKRATKVGVEMVLTANKEYFDEVGKEGTEKWIETNVEWLKKKYGDALVSCELHLDEKSPHFHCIIAAKATYTKKFRHGEKEVTRISYNHVFGDDMKTIVAARKANDSEMTKLGMLQTEYAEAMQELGLERGDKNAFKVHTTPRQHRALENADPSAKRPVVPKFKQMPELSKIEKAKALAMGGDPVEAWAKEIVRKARGHVEELEGYVSQKEVEALRSERMASVAYKAKGTVTGLRDKVNALENEVAMLKDKLSKEEIAELRKIPVSLVADSTGYADAINPKKHKNAIDFLMDTEGFDYNQSLAYLQDNFSTDEVKATIKQFLSDSVDTQAEIKCAMVEQRERGITQSNQEKAITHKVTEQLNALGAEEYRVTLMHEKNSTFTLNQRKNAEEHLYSQDEIKAPSIIRMLNVKNYKEGRNIFITPISSKHDFFFVDDMTPKSLEAVQTEGYTFSTITESSPNNYQGVIKTNKGDYTKAELNAFFKALNNRYGDEKITGQIHPFRLAGFQNMKEKHQQDNGFRPFVTIHKAIDTVCDYAKEQLEKLRSSFVKPVDSSVSESARNHEPIKLFSGLRKKAIMEESIKGFESGSRANIEPSDVTFATAKYAWIESQYPEPDMSRADIMVARDLASRGLDNEGIKEVLKNTSPNVDGRHSSNLDDYLDRTATKSRFNIVSASEQAERQGVRASNGNNTTTKHKGPK